ncbi:putative glucan endo-1,3-beta-glucosidase eglC [Fusarium oxysporum f. sp. albedinis]|nr:putative glucan endo-1,3-beta-glucosidase eglC [Fusarium oxysporum f. sp. albedinis]
MAPSTWSTQDPDAWEALYSPEAAYIDHAYLLNSKGKMAIRAHFDMVRHSIPDFIVSVERSWPSRELADGRVEYSFRTRNSGTFVNDFPTVKANGYQFSFPGAVDITVGADGLIQSVQEYYSTQGDKPAGIEFYTNFWDSES